MPPKKRKAERKNPIVSMTARYTIIMTNSKKNLAHG